MIAVFGNRTAGVAVSLIQVAVFFGVLYGTGENFILAIAAALIVTFITTMIVSGVIFRVATDISLLFMAHIGAISCFIIIALIASIIIGIVQFFYVNLIIAIVALIFLTLASLIGTFLTACVVENEMKENGVTRTKWTFVTIFMWFGFGTAVLLMATLLFLQGFSIICRMCKR